MGLAGTRMQPCPAAVAAPVTVPTAAFADGAHELRQCAVDFSGIEACSAPRPLLIDNGAPELAFVAPRPGEEPQRVEVTATDPASGVAAGRIAFRRAGESAWTALPTRLRAGASGARDAPRSRPGGGRRAAPLPGRSERRGRQHRDDDPLRRRLADGPAGALGPERRAGGPPGTEEPPERRGGHGKDAGRRGWRRPRRLARRRTCQLADGRLRRGRDPPRAPRRIGASRRSRPVGGRSCREADPGRRPVRPRRRPRPPHRDDADRRRRQLRAPPAARTLAHAQRLRRQCAGARSRPLHLRVRAGVSLAAEPSRLADRRDGPASAAGSAAAAPPSRAPASWSRSPTSSGRATRWRPVLVTRTDRAAASAAPYRFRYVTGLARIRLRATAPAEARWPYAPGSSPSAHDRGPWLGRGRAGDAGTG